MLRLLLSFAEIFLEFQVLHLLDNIYSLVAAHANFFVHQGILFFQLQSFAGIVIVTVARSIADVLVSSLGLRTRLRSTSAVWLFHAWTQRLSTCPDVT